MPFKIKYKFTGDEKYYTCVLSVEQYKNFRELPMVEKCEILKNTKEYKKYEEEMQRALNLAVKNNTTHILKLSENV